MRLAAPFGWEGDHIAARLPGARVLFTTRRGGVSTGPYESLNLGRWTDDDPDAVAENRSRAAGLAGATLAQGRQVHETTVERVTAVPSGDPTPADGQATALPGVAPAVLVADCLPIAIAGGGAVAMLHCGWRGLAGGIVAEGVRAVRELGGDEPLTAAIGPGAGACCYEVGDEVHAEFARFGDEVRRGRNLDLKLIARGELEKAGIQAVHDTELCTICADSRLFFSHRRDRGVTGRQAGLVWREPGRGGANRVRR
ncbi:MAG: purine-nucleoside/S-methyl-5-thioadenosine phosphorylase / adenosine deaminase [Solirubrobacteraceae bacterium]|nr:purine-nucleoside/S-methyl-5-thioadenosine phosphorylase / adenosine deaminase [Solirubrobacteraceae bacterium]